MIVYVYVLRNILILSFDEFFLVLSARCLMCYFALWLVLKRCFMGNEWLIFVF